MRRDKWEELKSTIEDIYNGNGEAVTINVRNICKFLLEYMKVLEKGEQDGRYKSNEG